MTNQEVARIPIQLSRDCVVASIQVDLDDGVLDLFRSDLLSLLQKSGASGVILDVAGIEVLDLEEFEALRSTMEMAALMGATTVFSGFNAGVVSALVDLDADTRGVRATVNLDEAYLEIERVAARSRIAGEVDLPLAPAMNCAAQMGSDES